MTTELIAGGLQRPVGMAAPDGDFSRIFVIEKRGRIRVIQDGVLLGTPFLDIDSLVGGGTSTNDERGLLGIAFHPDYLNNGFFYLDYTNNSSNTTIARYQVSGDPATSNVANPASGSVLLTISQPFANHNGGWIAFGPNDGYLYIAMGDGGSGGDPSDRAQNLNQRLGKLLRIDVDGGPPFGIPPDNPFVGVAGDDLIWAYGLRNPWRNSFDPITGDLIIADVGQNVWEEVDFQPGTSIGGDNYGWRCMEGNHCFTASSGCTCFEAGLVFPIHEYSHGGSPFRCSITGGEIYRGCAMPEMQGTYFFADFCSNQIWSFETDGVTISNFQDRTAELDPPSGFISSIASFGRDGFGEVYIIEQGSTASNGELWKIVPVDPTPVNDCNNNGIEDGCEVADGSKTDSNGNGVPDACECPGALAPPLAEAFVADPCVNDTDCPNEATCLAGRCYAPKNRYINVDLGGIPASVDTFTLRITHSASGRQWWMGMPGANGVAFLSNVPVPVPSHGLSVVAITGCGISPNQSYDLQLIASICDPADEANYSVPLTLATSAHWGDAVGGTTGGVWQPPNGVTNLEDVQALVQTFQGSPTAPPLAWADLGDEEPNQVANLSDALLDVLAFQGTAYPFSAPVDCP